LYGKLPSHGDFLRRRTSDAFVGAWDAWLQECMAASRSALGDRWLDLYLTSPVWRFSAAAGACGPAPVIGLMAPSVDRVGRYFPLTIVAEVPAHVTPVMAAREAGRFFDRAERLVIETIEADAVDFEGFDLQVTQLADELGPLRLRPPVALQEGASGLLADAAPCQVPIGSPDAIAPVFDQMLAAYLSAVYDPLMVWWTEGSSAVEPCCLLASGLPQPHTFAALLDGSWTAHQWRPVPAVVDGGSRPGDGFADAAPIRFQSAAASDVGNVRTINQDSYLELPESGLWVVADGIGGHSDGEVASRMVCDALADFQQVGTLDDTVAAARDRLEAVNGQLVRTAARSLLGDRCGSTVVALLVRGSQCAVLWAGDSRVYRWRSGRLEQMTRDHSVAASHAITRAIGAQALLELDSCRDQVRPGDRYLLCSDGLTHVVPDAGIAGCMEAADIAAAVQALIEVTRDGGAPDNVTALIVEASAGAAAFGGLSAGKR
jgi:type VI secretion system protein ImpM